MVYYLLGVLFGSLCLVICVLLGRLGRVTESVGCLKTVQADRDYWRARAGDVLRFEEEVAKYKRWFEQTRTALEIAEDTIAKLKSKQGEVG